MPFYQIKIFEDMGRADLLPERNTTDGPAHRLEQRVNTWLIEHCDDLLAPPQVLVSTTRVPEWDSLRGSNPIVSVKSERVVTTVTVLYEAAEASIEGTTAHTVATELASKRS